MRRSLGVVKWTGWVVAAAWMATACAKGAEQKQAGAPPAPPVAPTAPIGGQAVLTSATIHATVTKINTKTREVTLRTADGQNHDIVVDPAVKNLSQVRKGDVLSVTYFESVAWELVKGATATAGITEAKAMARRDTIPGAAAAHEVTATVTITAIDPNAPSVTFKGPNGNTRTFTVMHPERLQGVKVGDHVAVTYTEAYAVKVERAQKGK